MRRSPQLSGKLPNRLGRTARLLAFCFLVGACVPVLADPETEVTQLRVERTEEGVLLSAAVDFELPQVVEEALEKGIPMFFVSEAVLYRDRWYWYDKEVARAARHMRLSYQPLTRRWRLTISPSVIGSSGLALGQSFDTREEAMAAVRRVSGWKIAEADALAPDERYSVEYRFRLDVSQLPRPFQIGAVGQADWNISVAVRKRLNPDLPR